MKVVGDEGNESGSPVAVLLHGQPGVGADFHLVRIALQGKGLRVVTVDRDGYDGRTPATGYRGNADALVRLLDELAVDRARLLGLSWAGGAALAFGTAYPDRCDGLLLAASVGHPASLVRGDGTMALPGAARVARWVLPKIEALLESSSGSRLTSAERSLLERNARLAVAADGWPAFTVEQRALVHETRPLWDVLAPQGFPVTVVQGRRDGYVPARAGRALARRMDARYVEVDAGHLLHLEVPALLAAELAGLGA